MEEGDRLENLICKECKSRQIRTTSKFKICIRCGAKEKLQ